MNNYYTLRKSYTYKKSVINVQYSLHTYKNLMQECLMQEWNILKYFIMQKKIIDKIIE